MALLAVLCIIQPQLPVDSFYLLSSVLMLPFLDMNRADMALVGIGNPLASAVENFPLPDLDQEGLTLESHRSPKP